MHSSFSRYMWIARPLACILLIACFSPLFLPQLVRDLSSGPDVSGTAIATPSAEQSSADVGMVMHVCFDTPPLFSPDLGHRAALAIADDIDALVVPGFSGLRFSSSYISSSSYQDETQVNFALAPVPSLPAPPVQKRSPDLYQDALLKQAYITKLAAWQKQVNLQLHQLARYRARVRRSTDVLRKLHFGFDNRGADYYSCLLEGATHVQHVPKTETKLIVLVSALVNNQPEQGHLSLNGVSVKAVYFSCPDAAITCQTRVDTINHLVMAAHAKAFSVLDVAESEAQSSVLS